MDGLLNRSRRRKSDVVPLETVADEAQPVLGHRVARVQPMNWSHHNSIREDAELPSPSAVNADSSGRGATVKFPPVQSAKRLNRFAQSIISMNRQQQGQASDSRLDDPASGREEEGEQRTDNQKDDSVPPAYDPWSHVLGKVMRKTSFRTSGDSKRMSLTDMIKRREVKDLVKQAIVTHHWSEKAAAGRHPHGSSASPPRSSVMNHWMKTAVLRHSTVVAPGEDDDSGDDDAEDAGGIKSGFDVRDTLLGSMHGRTLLLEESCRRAFALTGENRSQMDLQALKAWFQMTKLKISTDFDRLQPAELDLLCRRMSLVHLSANDVLFRQGDEGDALYILFAGSVDVRVARRLLGEKLEVTVCELSKGDYFGERALLHDEPRAATIVAKTPCELVRITRGDYDLMLKQDQQEFFSRMQIAGSVAQAQHKHSADTTAAVKPSLLLPRSRSMLHAQTQLEYISVLVKQKHVRTKGDVDMLSEYLQTLKFFRGLPRTFVRELCSVVDFLTLPANAYVFQEGEVGDLFYIIFSGSVDVIVSSKDRRGNTQQTKLINLTEGSHFGELALMKGHGIRSATVLTREQTKFLVICEKDYNATLRRMQKEDFAKRMGALDRIPMFQTPEWTGDLLKEMSYVLSDHKLAPGAVLFRQGEKAQQVYFVVRGELVVTKEIIEPVSAKTHVVVVERVGRDRVVGDDAAAGANFNEIIYREVTVTASTPVELLVLSKYDVFHRLSRSARETLRAAAQCHVENVVYLDRFYKTTKWDAYKQRLLSERVNHDRLHKLLPHVDVKSTKATATPRTPRAATGRKESPEIDTPLRLRTPSTVVAVAAPPSDSSLHATAAKELVDANEFLLLDPVATAMAKCFPPTQRTLTQHVHAFNGDAPPRPRSRERQRRRAMTAEQRCHVDMLNEGNPLEYFDLDTVHAQQRQQEAQVRGRATSSRRLLMRARAPGASVTTPPGSPSGKGRGGENSALATADTSAQHAMNQFYQDNFIFSQPKKPVETGREWQRRTRQKDRGYRSPPGDLDSNRHKQENTNMTPGVPPAVGEIEVARQGAEQLCVGDMVVVDIEQLRPSGEPVATPRSSPAFRIVRCCESLEAASLLPPSSQGDHDASSALYVLPKRKFALLPRATRPQVAEEAQQRSVAGRFLRTPSASTAVHPIDPMATFASFQKLSRPPSNGREQTAVPRGNVNVATTAACPDLPTRRPYAFKLFACVSIVLAKGELEAAFCDEPFLCVHALYPTEAEAMESALLMPPQPLKCALLCILPVGEWLHFDDAYDWCVQNETDRRDKHPAQPARATTPTQAKARRSSCEPHLASDDDSPEPSRAEWELEKEKARQLHKFICARMGPMSKPSHDKARQRRGGGDDAVPATSGFTLEDKLTTLQEYLESTSHTSLGSKNAAPPAQVSILGKYRQMKLFGSIMRSRITAASPPLSATSGASGSTGLTGVVPGSG